MPQKGPCHERKMKANCKLVSECGNPASKCLLRTFHLSTLCLIWGYNSEYETQYPGLRVETDE